MASIVYTIITLYLAGLAIIGVRLSRRDGASAEHYFLGGRAMFARLVRDVRRTARQRGHGNDFLLLKIPPVIPK